MSQQRESRDPHDPISPARHDASGGSSHDSGFEDTPMPATEQHNESEGRLGEAYGRILTRLEESSGELSWDGLKAELDEAVRFESEVEEFTLDELALLRAWVERDMHEFRRHLAAGGEGIASWLGIDLSVLSRSVSSALLSIADRTVVDQAHFEEDLEAARADYTSGEVIAPGLLHCVHCDATTTLTHPCVLEPCHACGHRFFARGAPKVAATPGRASRDPHDPDDARTLSSPSKADQQADPRYARGNSAEGGNDHAGNAGHSGDDD
ncbi:MULTISPECIES: zinc ribbon-containing protein [Cobetia]|uniref:zinc ribbon-containing protein n=1 Tax=Cobetia TaxID=204286 RepID=UPI00046905EA